MMAASRNIVTSSDCIVSFITLLRARSFAIFSGSSCFFISFGIVAFDFRFGFGMSWRAKLFACLGAMFLSGRRAFDVGVDFLEKDQCPGCFLLGLFIKLW